jgi:hypothetical protein
MTEHNEILLRMEKIRTIFQAAKDVSTEHEKLTSLLTHFKNAEPEFYLVAYEGASMGIALNDFSNNDASLNGWQKFLNGPASNYSTQAHIGLGWALAQQNKSPLPLIDTLDPLIQYRILDGYGYYDGILKQRSTIKNKKTPLHFSEKNLQAYDQGVGRSLWYICKGEIEKVSELLLSFPAARHAALWRGIGTASAFVGGLNETLLRNLWLSSSEHSDQLVRGAKHIAKSRIQTNSLTPDIELACRIWCNISVKEVMLLDFKTEPV